MADDDDEEYITLFVTQVSPSSKFEVCVAASATVEELKRAIEEQHEVPAERQRLIWKGRVLVDAHTLPGLGIGDGQPLFLAMSAPPPQAAPVSVPSQRESDTVTIPMLGNVPTSMMRAMADNPMTQALLSNPDMMRDVLMATNPGIRDAMERNPALRHALNDPDTMRQAAEMMRNPAAMQHMTRSMDLQMQQISNLPGGEIALNRAMGEMFDPLEAGNRRAEEEAERAREEARVVPDAPPAGTPLPNPWAGRGGGGGAAAGAAGGAAGMGGMPGMGAGMGFGGGMGMGAGAMAGNPMIQQMMQQMMANPQAMQQMQQAMMQHQPAGGGAGFNAADYSPMLQQQQAAQRQAMAAAGAIGGGGRGGGAPTPAGSAPAGAPAAQQQQQPSSAGAGIPAGPYAVQLQQMADMGFPNREANIAALTMAGGNVELAIASMLSGA